MAKGRPELALLSFCSAHSNGASVFNKAPSLSDAFASPLLALGFALGAGAIGVGRDNAGRA